MPIRIQRWTDGLVLYRPGTGEGWLLRTVVGAWVNVPRMLRYRRLTGTLRGYWRWPL